MIKYKAASIFDYYTKPTKIQYLVLSKIALTFLLASVNFKLNMYLYN